MVFIMMDKIKINEDFTFEFFEGVDLSGDTDSHIKTEPLSTTNNESSFGQAHVEVKEEINPDEDCHVKTEPQLETDNNTERNELVNIVEKIKQETEDEVKIELSTDISNNNLEGNLHSNHKIPAEVIHQIKTEPSWNDNSNNLGLTNNVDVIIIEDDCDVEIIEDDVLIDSNSNVTCGTKIKTEEIDAEVLNSVPEPVLQSKNNKDNLLSAIITCCATATDSVDKLGEPPGTIPEQVKELQLTFSNKNEQIKSSGQKYPKRVSETVLEEVAVKKRRLNTSEVGVIDASTSKSTESEFSADNAREMLETNSSLTSSEGSSKEEGSSCIPIFSSSCNTFKWIDLNFDTLRQLRPPNAPDNKSCKIKLKGPKGKNSRFKITIPADPPGYQPPDGTVTNDEKARRPSKDKNYRFFIRGRDGRRRYIIIPTDPGYKECSVNYDSKNPQTKAVVTSSPIIPTNSKSQTKSENGKVPQKTSVAPLSNGAIKVQSRKVKRSEEESVIEKPYQNRKILNGSISSLNRKKSAIENALIQKPFKPMNIPPEFELSGTQSSVEVQSRNSEGSSVLSEQKQTIPKTKENLIQNQQKPLGSNLKPECSRKPSSNRAESYVKVTGTDSAEKNENQNILNASSSGSALKFHRYVKDNFGSKESGSSVASKESHKSCDLSLEIPQLNSRMESSMKFIRTYGRPSVKKKPYQSEGLVQNPSQKALNNVNNSRQDDLAGKGENKSPTEKPCQNQKDLNVSKTSVNFQASFIGKESSSHFKQNPPKTLHNSSVTTTTKFEFFGMQSSGKVGNSGKPLLPEQKQTIPENKDMIQNQQKRLNGALTIIRPFGCQRSSNNGLESLFENEDLVQNLPLKASTVQSFGSSPNLQYKKDDFAAMGSRSSSTEKQSCQNQKILNISTTSLNSQNVSNEKRREEKKASHLKQTSNPKVLDILSVTTPKFESSEKKSSAVQLENSGRSYPDKTPLPEQKQMIPQNNFIQNQQKPINVPITVIEPLGCQRPSNNETESSAKITEMDRKKKLCQNEDLVQNQAPKIVTASASTLQALGSSANLYSRKDDLVAIGTRSSIDNKLPTQKKPCQNQKILTTTNLNLQNSPNLCNGKQKSSTCKELSMEKKASHLEQICNLIQKPKNLSAPSQTTPKFKSSGMKPSAKVQPGNSGRSCGKRKSLPPEQKQIIPQNKSQQTPMNGPLSLVEPCHNSPNNGVESSVKITGTDRRKKKQLGQSEDLVQILSLKTPNTSTLHRFGSNPNLHSKKDDIANRGVRSSTGNKPAEKKPCQNQQISNTCSVSTENFKNVLNGQPKFSTDQESSSEKTLSYRKQDSNLIQNCPKTLITPSVTTTKFETSGNSARSEEEKPLPPEPQNRNLIQNHQKPVITSQVTVIKGVDPRLKVHSSQRPANNGVEVSMKVTGTERSSIEKKLCQNEDLVQNPSIQILNTSAVTIHLASKGSNLEKHHNLKLEPPRQSLNNGMKSSVEAIGTDGRIQENKPCQENLVQSTSSISNLNPHFGKNYVTKESRSSVDNKPSAEKKVYQNQNGQVKSSIGVSPRSHDEERRSLHFEQNNLIQNPKSLSTKFESLVEVSSRNCNLTVAEKKSVQSSETYCLDSNTSISKVERKSLPPKQNQTTLQNRNLIQNHQHPFNASISVIKPHGPNSKLEPPRRSPKCQEESSVNITGTDKCLTEKKLCQNEELVQNTFQKSVRTSTATTHFFSNSLNDHQLRNNYVANKVKRFSMENKSSYLEKKQNKENGSDQKLRNLKSVPPRRPSNCGVEFSVEVMRTDRIEKVEKKDLVQNSSPISGAGLKSQCRNDGPADRERRHSIEDGNHKKSLKLEPPRNSRMESSAKIETDRRSSLEKKLCQNENLTQNQAEKTLSASSSQKILHSRPSKGSKSPCQQNQNIENEVPLNLTTELLRRACTGVESSITVIGIDGRSSVKNISNTATSKINSFGSNLNLLQSRRDDFAFKEARSSVENNRVESSTNVTGTNRSSTEKLCSDTTSSQIMNGSSASSNHYRQNDLVGKERSSLNEPPCLKQIQKNRTLLPKRNSIPNCRNSLNLKTCRSSGVAQSGNRRSAGRKNLKQTSRYNQNRNCIQNHEKVAPSVATKTGSAVQSGTCSFIEKDKTSNMSSTRTLEQNQNRNLEHDQPESVMTPTISCGSSLKLHPPMQSPVEKKSENLLQNSQAPHQKPVNVLSVTTTEPLDYSSLTLEFLRRSSNNGAEVTSGSSNFTTKDRRFSTYSKENLGQHVSQNIIKPPNLEQSQRKESENRVPHNQNSSLLHQKQRKVSGHVAKSRTSSIMEKPQNDKLKNPGSNLKGGQSQKLASTVSESSPILLNDCVQSGVNRKNETSNQQKINQRLKNSKQGYEVPLPPKTSKNCNLTVAKSSSSQSIPATSSSIPNTKLETPQKLLNGLINTILPMEVARLKPVQNSSFNKNQNCEFTITTVTPPVAKKSISVPPLKPTTSFQDRDPRIAKKKLLQTMNGLHNGELGQKTNQVSAPTATNGNDKKRMETKSGHEENGVLEEPNKSLDTQKSKSSNATNPDEKRGKKRGHDHHLQHQQPTKKRRAQGAVAPSNKEFLREFSGAEIELPNAEGHPPPAARGSKSSAHPPHLTRLPDYSPESKTNKWIKVHFQNEPKTRSGGFDPSKMPSYSSLLRAFNALSTAFALQTRQISEDKKKKRRHKQEN